MIDEAFLKHPRKRGHRFRLHWKHYFRKLAIERALELEGDFEKNFFDQLDEISEGFHPTWKHELRLFNKGEVTIKHITSSENSAERIIGMVPDVIDKVSSVINKFVKDKSPGSSETDENE